MSVEKDRKSWKNVETRLKEQKHNKPVPNKEAGLLFEFYNTMSHNQQSSANVVSLRLQPQEETQATSCNTRAENTRWNINNVSPCQWAT